MLNGILDPYVGFRFMVDIEGLFVGGFQEVSGLSIELDVESVKEGGVNDYTHRLPKGVKYGDIVLKRGLGDINMLWAWYNDIVSGGNPIVRRSGSIRMLNSMGIPTYSWDFLEAYPIKWEASGISSSSNAVVTESMTLAHHGLKKFDLGVGGLLNAAANKISGLF